jgi:phosphatidylserine/phosphatidylglycerophosphate/cardiolipin synthase-like enzyme
VEGRVQIVVTGTAWMGHAIGSVLSALESLFLSAEDELLVVAYAVGTGAGSLLDLMEQAARRGRKVVAVINRFDAQPPEVRRRLFRLVRDHPWCRVFDFSSPDPDEELHAKIVVADRTRVFLGSPNLSRRGLVLNYELAVVIEGTPAAEVARVIDLLLQDRRLVHPVVPPGEEGSMAGAGR